MNQSAPNRCQIESERRHNDVGLTLVELLIVIVILGVLSSVTVFAVGGISSMAQDNTCGVERRTLETAATAYLTDLSLMAIPGVTSADRHQELVAARLILEPADDKFDLAGDGTVAVVAGGVCDT